jgi:hypothetical protein
MQGDFSGADQKIADVSAFRSVFGLKQIMTRLKNFPVAIFNLRIGLNDDNIGQFEALKFFPCVAQILTGPVIILDQISDFWIDHDDGIGGLLEKRPVARFAFAQGIFHPFARGDVVDQRLVMRWISGRVANDGYIQFDGKG